MKKEVVITIGILLTVFGTGFLLYKNTDTEIVVLPNVKVSDDELVGPVGQAVPPVIRGKIGDRELSFNYKDDNTGEDVIIATTDSHYGSIFGSTYVTFSVTNTTASDEVYAIAISTDPNSTLEYSALERFDGNSTTTIKGKRVPASATSSAYFEDDTIIVEPIWTDLPLVVFSGTAIQRKDLLNTQTDKISPISVPAGETVFLRTLLTYDDLPDTGTEFLIEAFGSNGSYGHLR